MAKGVKHYKKDGSEHKGGTHTMENGEIDSGASHTEKSVKLRHFGDLSKRANAKARSNWR